MFLLRPDDETNNAFLYCLIEAAIEFKIHILLSQMMSNHHHTIVYDEHGTVNEFTQRFHMFLAKCQNALRGRCDHHWDNAPPSIVELADVGAVLKELVYVATNPVKDGLVAKVHQWPGPKTVRSLLTQTPLRARRPRHFFRDDGPMREAVEMTFTIPEHLGNPAKILAYLRNRIDEVETACATERQATQRQVMGSRRILRQSWRASPLTPRPRRTIRPRVAAKCKWKRIAALQRLREFVAAHRDARHKWLDRIYVLFPPGTYWLHRFANVPVAPLPAS